MKTIMLKLLAFIFGVSLWYIFSQSRHDTMSLEVPLCFYDAGQNICLQAPETIHVTLAGRRVDLCALDQKNLVAHVNASKFNEKTSKLLIESQYLFLPATIKLIHYTPAPVPVRVLVQGAQL